MQKEAGGNIASSKFGSIQRILYRARYQTLNSSSGGHSSPNTNIGCRATNSGGERCAAAKELTREICFCHSRLPFPRPAPPPPTPLRTTRAHHTRQHAVSPTPSFRSPTRSKTRERGSAEPPSPKISPWEIVPPPPPAHPPLAERLLLRWCHRRRPFPGTAVPPPRTRSARRSRPGRPLVPRRAPTG